jgi:uncharacterized Zn-finger protein
MTQPETPMDALSPPVIKVTRRDLPVSCPPRDQPTAGLHPRVYIPLEQIGDEINCPYCGTRYRLVE